MSDESARFLRGLNKGDDAALEKMYELYMDKLCALVERNMGGHISGSPESIAMSVMASMVSGIRKRGYEFGNSRKLWNLFFAIALNKIRKRAGYGPKPIPSDLIDCLVRTPRPEDAHVMQKEVIEKALIGLDSLAPEILVLNLQGCTQQEISQKLRTTSDTVSLVTTQIRERLERMLKRRRDLNILNQCKDTSVEDLYHQYLERFCDVAEQDMEGRQGTASETPIMSVMRFVIDGIRERHFMHESAQGLWNLLFAAAFGKICKGHRVKTVGGDFIDVLMRKPTDEDDVIIRDLIEKLLEGLDSPYPEILALRLEGFTQTEIADKLGPDMTRNMVKIRLKRIRERLERMLELDTRA